LRILNDARDESIHLVEINLFHGFDPWSGFVRVETKKPAGIGRRRAWVFPDLSGRLRQAMEVRRHGGRVVVVMTVMVAALHLIQTLSRETLRCQMRWGQLKVLRALSVDSFAFPGLEIER
jgi:hypothetical protein